MQVFLPPALNVGFYIIFMAFVDWEIFHQNEHLQYDDCFKHVSELMWSVAMCIVFKCKRTTKKHVIDEHKKKALTNVKSLESIRLPSFAIICAPNYTKKTYFQFVLFMHTSNTVYVNQTLWSSWKFRESVFNVHFQTLDVIEIVMSLIIFAFFPAHLIQTFT